MLGKLFGFVAVVAVTLVTAVVFIGALAATFFGGFVLLRQWLEGTELIVVAVLWLCAVAAAFGNGLGWLSEQRKS